MAHSKIMIALRGCQEHSRVFLGNLHSGSVFVSDALRRLLRLFRDTAKSEKVAEILQREASTHEHTHTHTHTHTHAIHNL